jgi:cell division septum initiation protein DivIVA
MTQYENRPTHEAESRDDASLDRLESDIAVTRERMRDDLGQLGDRLSPQHLKAEAKARVREAAYGAADTMKENTREAGSRFAFAVRENPIPTAMVGVGLSWLAMKAFRGERRYETYESGYAGRYDYGRTYSYGRDYPYGPYTAVGESETEERGSMGARVGEAREKIADAASSAVGTMKEKASALGERASELAGTTRERAGELASTTRERAGSLRSNLSGQASLRARQARSGFDRGLSQNPMAMALGALVLGLTAGLLIPETERENEMLGPTRDRLLERGRDVAERVGGAVSEAAKGEASSLVDTVKSTAQELVGEAKDAAGRVAQEAKSTVASEAKQSGSSSGTSPSGSMSASTGASSGASTGGSSASSTASRSNPKSGPGTSPRA